VGPYTPLNDHYQVDSSGTLTFTWENKKGWFRSSLNYYLGLVEPEKRKESFQQATSNVTESTETLYQPFSSISSDSSSINKPLSPSSSKKTETSAKPRRKRKEKKSRRRNKLGSTSRTKKTTAGADLLPNLPVSKYWKKSSRSPSPHSINSPHPFSPFTNGEESSSDEDRDEFR